MLVEIGVSGYDSVVSNQRRESFFFREVFDEVISVRSFDVVGIGILSYIVRCIRDLFGNCERSDSYLFQFLRLLEVLRVVLKEDFLSSADRSSEFKSVSVLVCFWRDFTASLIGRRINPFKFIFSFRLIMVKCIGAVNGIV